MAMRLLLLSDIHGNLSALDAVLADAQTRYRPEAVVLLGDYIDYGMRPNEVVARLQSLDLEVVCALWGNHEQAVLTADFSRFSSPRGAESARYTRSRLTPETIAWLEALPGRAGWAEFSWNGRRILAVHGSLAEPYWKSVAIRDDLASYASYDYVLSGHNHVPHAFTIFSEVDDPAMRNRKGTAFINPGSVGQPRNHVPRAHYAVLDPGCGVHLVSCGYDVAHEQSLYDGSVDVFYRDRLAKGV